MRKNLLVTLLTFICVAVSLNAQIIDDNIDSYSVGAIGPQAEHWTTWSGNEGNLVEDGLVSESQAASGDKSMYINDGGSVDVLLLLGNKTSGQYELSWNMYLVPGKIGYYNIQEDEVPGVAWNLDVFFGTSGGAYTPGIADFTVNQVSLSTFEYPEGEWFNIKHVIDLDENLLTYFVDDVEVYQIPYEGNLGAVDFFSIEQGTNEYYVDDVFYVNNSEPIDVTFQVDMSYEETVAEPVNFISDFNDWEPVAMSDDDGDGIWSVTVSMLGDNSYLYNFANGAGTDEAESDIDDCGTDNGVFGLSRSVNIGGEATVLDPICYNTCTDCATAYEVDVAFAVDMNFQEISDDGVFVIVDEDDPIAMTDEDEDGVYEVTASILKNASHLYHFVNGSDNETVPDDCATDSRRGLELADESVNLEIVCFSECTDCIAANEIEVTFSVDMQDVGEISNSGVFLVGDFIGYNPAAGEGVPMVVAQDSVYEATVVLYKNTDYTYLFVNGDNILDSETLSGQECGTDEGGRALTTPAESTTLETVCFQSCEACPEDIVDPMGIDDLIIYPKAYPNPTSGIVNIDHSFDLNSTMEITVYNSIGQEVLKSSQISTGQLSLDLSNFTNDVYFVEITNGTQFSAQKLFKID